MAIRGVDISQYDAPVDFAKLKAAGFEFAIARCVREASLGIDATFAGHVTRARAAGLIAGAYDFLSHGYGPAHAAAFVSQVRGMGGPTGMLLALDIEAAGLVAADVDAWMTGVRAAFPGHPILQYGSQYNQLSWSSSAKNGALWLANYGVNPAGSWDEAYAARGGDGSSIWGRSFNGWTGPAFWQFGSNGAVPGLGRATVADLDAFKGSLGDLRHLAGLRLAWTFDREPERLVDGTRFDCRGTVNVWDPQRPNAPVAQISGAIEVRWRCGIRWLDGSHTKPIGYPFLQISAPGPYFNSFVVEADGELVPPGGI